MRGRVAVLFWAKVLVVHLIRGVVLLGLCGVAL